MNSPILRGIGSFIFWTYERGTWQYDLKVALILAFIFVTPRGLFHDRPTLAESGRVVEVRGLEGTGYRVDAKALQGSTRSLEISAEHILEEVTGRPVEVLRVEPVLDQHKRITAYTIWIKDQGK